MGKIPGKSIRGWCLCSFDQQRRTPWSFVVLLVMLSQLLGVEGSTGIKSSSWPCPDTPTIPPGPESTVQTLQELWQPGGCAHALGSLGTAGQSLPCCCPCCPQDRGVPAGSRALLSHLPGPPGPFPQLLPACPGCTLLESEDSISGFPGSARWAVLMWQEIRVAKQDFPLPWLCWL